MALLPLTVQVQRTGTESMRMNFRVNGPRSVEVVDGAVRESSFRFLSMQQPPHKVLFTVAIYLVKAHSMPRWSQTVLVSGGENGDGIYTPLRGLS